jgi:hypothetical protein
MAVQQGEAGAVYEDGPPLTIGECPGLGPDVPSTRVRI